MFLTMWGVAGAADGQFGAVGPAQVAVDSSGNVWVADPGNDRVQEFDGSGTFLAKFGTSGGGAGELSGPDGVATAAGGVVYVADTGNNRIQKFSCP